MPFGWAFRTRVGKWGGMTATDAPGAITSLGLVGNTRVSVARTAQPWALDIDTIVVSVGPDGMGMLGAALRGVFPAAQWDSIQFATIRPNRPQVLDLGSEAPLRRAVLIASQEQTGGDITGEALRTATRYALELAVEVGAQSVGFPLLATGALAESVENTADVVVPAAVETVSVLSPALAELVFVSRAEGPAAAIENRFNRLQEEYSELDLSGGISREHVDPNEGIPLSRDDLGVAPYVGMLASVMSDRSTPPPLSVGVFGEWGSGKSYFMALLRDRIDVLMRSGDQRYCAEVVQIGFNAWHYADSNLWASLSDEIFRQLAGPEPSSRRRADRIRAELAERLDQREQLEFATAQARDVAAVLKSEADEAIAERRVRAGDLLEALRNSRAFGATLNDIWSRVGITDQMEQTRLFAEETRGASTEAQALRSSSSERHGRIALVAALVLLIVGVLVAAVAPDVWQGLAVALTPAAVAAGAAGRYLHRARDGLQRLRAVATDIQSELNEKLDDAERADLEQPLHELRAAEARHQVVQAQLDEVVARVGELGRQLTQLAPGRRLREFVADRAHGDSYTRKLGLVSTVRRDFQQLAELMDEWRVDPEPDRDRKPIERIVLYIDDLDRCRPEQVVEVLQAVHLLLAFELFIVVVGVDPRWLLRSLDAEYSELIDEGIVSRPDNGKRTAEAYLEKVLNIPMVLPTMQIGNLDRLLRSMQTEGSMQAAGATDGPVRRATVVDQAMAQATTASPGSAPERPENVIAGPSDPAEIDIEPGSEVGDSRTGAVGRVTRSLTEAELVMLSALDLLVTTPREAKRIFNLYRMVRATRDLSEASRFLGAGGVPGEYQAVVVLLGVLTAPTRVAVAVLDAPPDSANGIEGGLAHRLSTVSFRRFAHDLEPVRTDQQGWANRIAGALPDAERPDWERLHRGLENLSAYTNLPDLTAIQHWVPRIRRFSYVITP